MTMKKLTTGVFVALFAIFLAGCSSTWEGVKEDTGDNMEATGKAIEEAGGKVKE